MKFSIQKIAQWVKVRTIRKVVTVVLIALMSVFIWGKVMDGTKVIDPSNPRFNPEKFRFEDYSGIQNSPEAALLAPALLKMFPIGTPKKYIEEILIDQAGASISDYRGGQNGKVYRKYPSFDRVSGWMVVVIYDDQENAIDLRMGPQSLYFKDEN